MAVLRGKTLGVRVFLFLTAIAATCPGVTAAAAEGDWPMWRSDAGRTAAAPRFARQACTCNYPVSASLALVPLPDSASWDGPPQRP